MPAGYYTTTELAAAVATAMNADIHVEQQLSGQIAHVDVHVRRRHRAHWHSSQRHKPTATDRWVLAARHAGLRPGPASAGSLLTATHVPDLVGDTRMVQVLLHDGDGAHTADAKSRPATFYLMLNVNPGEGFVWWAPGQLESKSSGFRRDDPRQNR